MSTEYTKVPMYTNTTKYSKCATRKIRGIVTTDGDFTEIVILVIKEHGRLSELQQYPT